MFKSNKLTNHPHHKAMDTLVGAGTVMDEKLYSEASLRIEGTIHVDVECAGDVIVGETGLIKANITAKEIIIAGSVSGNVTAKSKLQIMPAGKLEGAVNTPSLIILEGGSFNGTSQMVKNTPSPLTQRDSEVKAVPTPERNDKAEAVGN